MAGVGHEPPHPLLGVVRRRLGLLPGVEGRLDLAQHDVQRPAEAADLGAGITLGHAAVQVAVGDLTRGLLMSTSGRRLARTTAMMARVRMSSMARPTISSVRASRPITALMLPR